MTYHFVSIRTADEVSGGLPLNRMKMQLDFGTFLSQRQIPHELHHFIASDLTNIEYIQKVRPRAK